MIIGFSGKKQSGKSSCAKWVIAAFLKYANLVSGAGVTDNGDLFVEYLTTEGEGVREVIDIDKGHPLLEAVSPFVNVFSMADELKAIGVRVFGIDPKCVFGTDEQKNQPTHIKWADLKFVFTKKEAEEFERGKHAVVGDYVTGRGFLQVFGSNICRRIFPDCWVTACINNINTYGSQLSLIPDIRFPNELEKVQEAGGKVIRLKRRQASPDMHASEVALDNVMDEGFDKVIYNRDYSMSQLCEQLYITLKGWNALPFEIQG
jgi:hypothetical protein